MKNFADLLIESILKVKSYLCVGLDPQLRYYPAFILEYCAKQFPNDPFRATEEAIFMFNKSIIDATGKYAACFKPQSAFYEMYGSYGIKALERTVGYLKALGKPIILDAKREDGGDTSMAYAKAYLGSIPIYTCSSGSMGFDEAPSRINVDAMTITNWIGEPNITQFMEIIKENGKGLFVVNRTSFKPPSLFQDMEVNGEKGWTLMAKNVVRWGKEFIGENGYSSIGVVLGATFPEDAQLMKELIPRAFKLVPGVGAQGGYAKDAVISINDDGFGIIVNNSRGTNYAYLPEFKSEFVCDSENFPHAAAKEAKKVRDLLNEAVCNKIGFLPWEKKDR